MISVLALDGSNGERKARKRGRSLAIGFLALALGLLFAASAWAAGNTVAPIGAAGSGNWLVTMENTEAETARIPLILLEGEEEAKAITSSAECHYGQPVSGTLIGCSKNLEPGEQLQVCYHGPVAVQIAFVYLEQSGLPKAFPISSAPAVGSCPFPNFSPPVPGGGSTAPPAPVPSTGKTPPATAPSLGKVTANTKAGTATLSVNVTGAGSVKLTGKGVKGKTVQAKGAGAVKLPIKATGSAAKTLNEDGSVKVHVVVTVTPTGGAATQLKKTVTLKKS